MCHVSNAVQLPKAEAAFMNNQPTKQRVGSELIRQTKLLYQIQRFNR